MAKVFHKLSSLHCDLGDICPEETQWLWEVNDFTPVLNWFLNYVEESNAISKLQVQQYSDWCKDGRELFGEELDKALEEHGVDVHKYFHSNFSEIDLEMCDQEVNTFKKHYKYASEIEKLLSEQLQISLTNEHCNETKRTKATVSCQKEGQNLMKINVPFKATISNLFGNILKLVDTLKDSEDPDVYNCCISNMPLENALSSWDKFNDYASLCLKRKFEQASHSETRAVSDIMSILEEESSIGSSTSSSITTDGLPKRMWQTALQCIAMQGTLRGYIGAMNHLESLKGNTSLEKLTPLQMKMEVSKLQDNIAKLSDDIDLVLKYEVSNTVEDIVVCDITHVAQKITQSRIERRQVMLRSLCSVSNVTHKFLHLTDLVWMSIILESRRFKFGSAFLDEISEFFTEELNNHETTMSTLNMVINDNNVDTDALSEGQALLLNMVQKLLNTTASESDPEIGNLPENLHKESGSTQVSDILDLTEKQCERESTFYELLAELTKGPTRKLSLVNKDLIIGMQEINRQLQECSTESESLASKFSSKKLAFKKSEVMQNRRLLWAWFLVAPEKLQQAVQLAREESSIK